MEKSCVHKFVSTGKKGEWTVKSQVNQRGKVHDRTVSTTVFRCTACGIMKEFPNFWSRNYIVPTNHIAEGTLQA